MNRKHYINELHKLGYAIYDLYEKNGDEPIITQTALLRIIKDILGNDFGCDDKEITRDAWRFWNEDKEA